MKSLKASMWTILAFNLFFTQSLAYASATVKTEEYKTSIELTSSQDQIEKVFNTYRYKMSVIFDGNNEAFKSEAKQQLKLDLLALEANGVNPNEIQAYVEANILSQNAKVEYQKLLETLEKQGRSEEEASQIAMTFAEANGAEGLSFAGSRSRSWKKIAIILGVIIVGVLTYILIKKLKEKKTETITQTDTETSTETETNTETETETETNTETETETNTETETETNTETQTETQTETNTETQTETNTETQTETNTETQTETNTETQTETHTETQTETETYTETQTETNTCTGSCGEDNLPHGISFVIYTLADGTTIKIEGYSGDIKDSSDPAQYIAYIEALTGQAISGYVIKAGTGYYNESGTAVGSVSHQTDYESSLGNLFSGNWWN